MLQLFGYKQFTTGIRNSSEIRGISIETPRDNIGTVSSPWYVLVTSDPRQAKYHLDKESMRDQLDGRPAGFQTFAPYTYMDDDLLPEERGADGKLSLRAALHRYIFVQGDEQRLAKLVYEWNAAYDAKMFFLRNHADSTGDTRKNATISAENMRQLMAACSTEDTSLDIPLHLYELKPGDKIRLVNTPFEGTGSQEAEYVIEEVRRKQGGVYQLRVSLQLFGIAFRNLYVNYIDPTAGSAHAELVKSTQKKLLDIFRRKVNGKETDVSRYEDQKTLVSLFALRATLFPPGAMQRHFLALMLICAQLLGDTAGRSELTQQAEAQLADIGKLRESKAATDTRAYLHIALYIATGKPQYRELAKAYMRKYDPKSASLRQLITTASKREALKFLG